VKRAAILLGLLLAPPAGAHDYWLVPETFAPKDGADVPVRMFVGDGFKPEQEVPYSSKKTAAVWLVTAAKTRKNFEEPKDGAADGIRPAFRFKMEGTGTAVFRVDRDWSSITLKADKFTEYLREEGLDEVVKLRAAAGESKADGKERYRRYLKAIVQGSGKPDDTPTEPVGQLFEIVPLKNPYSLKAGDTLPLKVLFDDKPLAGQKVRAYHRDGDAVTAVGDVTDKEGEVSLKLSKKGVWLVRTVHMRRVAEKKPDPPADWESFWAGVTFEVPSR
jgi:hypothetical protein